MADLVAEGPQSLDDGGIDVGHLRGERHLDLTVGRELESTVLAGLEMGGDLRRELFVHVVVEIALQDSADLVAVDLGPVAAA